MEDRFRCLPLSGLRHGSVPQGRRFGRKFLDGKDPREEGVETE